MFIGILSTSSMFIGMLATSMFIGMLRTSMFIH